MTGNEIIKALECCRDCNCKECPACRIIDGGTYCTEIDEEEILDLINRQKAEIEKLTTLCTEQNEELGRLQKVTANILKVMKENISQTKAEAIKEFAERLKESPSVTNCENEWLYLDIDNLVKEMVGDSE